MFSGPGFIANLSGGLKTIDTIFISYIDIGKLLFVTSLKHLKSFLATLTHCLFCSSVNRCGTHLEKGFQTFETFFNIRWTINSDMPTLREISRTVNLVSPSMISFIFETTSLRDSNFDLPDLCAFLMDSTPDSNLFSSA